MYVRLMDYFFSVPVTSKVLQAVCFLAAIGGLVALALRARLWKLSAKQLDGRRACPESIKPTKGCVTRLGDRLAYLIRNFQRLPRDGFIPPLVAH